MTSIVPGGSFTPEQLAKMTGNITGAQVVLNAILPEHWAVSRRFRRILVDRSVSHQALPETLLAAANYFLGCPVITGEDTQPFRLPLAR